MANRVILGNRGGVYGLFVSQPGYDVTSCTDGQLMFDSRVGANQCLQMGTISGGQTINFSFGFAPIAIVLVNQAFGVTPILYPCTATALTNSTGSNTNYWLFRPN